MSIGKSLVLLILSRTLAILLTGLDLDESESEEPLPPDMVEVVWSHSQKVSEVNFNDLVVLDRGFTHGDLCSPVEGHITSLIG